MTEKSEKEKIVIKPISREEALCVRCKKCKPHQKNNCPFSQALWEFYTKTMVALVVPYCFLYEPKE